MNITSVAKDIELLMGSGVVRLEVSTEEIERLVKMAFQIIKPKIDQDIFITVTASSFIDLKPYKVKEVLRVLPTVSDYNGSGNGLAMDDATFNFGWSNSVNRGSIGAWGRGYGYGYGGDTDCCGSVHNIHQSGAYLEGYGGEGASGTYLQSIRNNIIDSFSVMENDIPFEFRAGTLMIPAGYTTGRITAQCIIDMNPEHLQDETAIKWIREYAHALTKETVGRIRSKFRTGSVPIENDGETLLSEANSDKDRLMSELNDKDYGPIYILR